MDPGVSQEGGRNETGGGDCVLVLVLTRMNKSHIIWLALSREWKACVSLANQ